MDCWSQTAPISSSPSTVESNFDAQAVFAGQLLYLDEPIFWGGGGSIRYYFSDRFGVEGEVLWVKSSGFEDILVTPYFVFRFGRSGGNKSSWYLKGGIGLRHETDLRIDYTYNDRLVQGAIGFRAAISEKAYFVAEGRFVGFAAGIGYSF